MDDDDDDMQNMPPEQLQEAQKKNCIFCQIISGVVSSKKIYEDELVIAILDINPANPGHVLVMPKEHYVVMPQMPDDEISHLGQVIKGISHACLKALIAQGTNIFAANGAIAGQRAPHFMVHIIPRLEQDKISSFTLPERRVTPESLAEIQKEIVPRINSLFGLTTIEPINLDKRPQKMDMQEIHQMQTEKPDVKTQHIAEKSITKKPATDLDSISNLLLGK